MCPFVSLIYSFSLGPILWWCYHCSFWLYILILWSRATPLLIILIFQKFHSSFCYLCCQMNFRIKFPCYKNSLTGILIRINWIYKLILEKISILMILNFLGLWNVSQFCFQGLQFSSPGFCIILKLIPRYFISIAVWMRCFSLAVVNIREVCNICIASCIWAPFNLTHFWHHFRLSKFVLFFLSIYFFFWCTSLWILTHL